MGIFAVRSIPAAGWSSRDPFILRPKPKTVFLLALGLFLFGAGEAMLIAAGVGVSPWTVLAQGVGSTVGIGIGVATFAVSVLVLLLWIPLRQRIGIGTLLNTVIISATIEYLLPFLPSFDSFGVSLFQACLGTVVVGLGSGIYLVANLGPGPRDGLMTGLQRVTGAPVAPLRAGIELTVVLAGWLLGGMVGIGTVVFALGIGPAVSAGLYLTARCSGVSMNTSRGL